MQVNRCSKGHGGICGAFRIQRRTSSREVIHENVLIGVIIGIKHRRIGVALVVLAGPPQPNDDEKNDGEEDVPEGVVHPNLAPVLQGRERKREREREAGATFSIL